MRKLYCFDFDGTVTNRDTMFLYLRHCRGYRFYIEFLRYAPIFILVKLRLTSASKAKQSFIKALIGGYSKKELEELAQSFFDNYQDKIIRKTACEFFDNIGEESTAYFVTASLDLWVEPFAKYFKFGLIATRAEYQEGRFTGNFLGKNCNHKEKVRRIKQEIDLKGIEKTVAFGDSRGDREMLAWADESYYNYFH